MVLHVCAGQRGSLVYIPYRGCEMEVRHLNQMFDHGQVGMMPFSPRDEASIYEAVKNSDLVINLIGKDYETKHLVPTRRADGSISNTNYGFEDTLVTIPQTIARISREAGVKSFIHMSALSANPNSKSKWARCKARGEEVVRQEFSDAVRVSFVMWCNNCYVDIVGDLLYCWLGDLT
jgi:NADH dehydrogenase (ubiquinone) 1 alpha subcomplex subunit 9